MERCVNLTAGLAAMLLLFSASGVAQERDIGIENRRQLTKDLSLVVLGSSEPLSLGSDLGWRALVLASPGAPLSPTISAFDPNGVATRSVSQLFENMNLYDRVMLVTNGICYPGTANTAQVWEDLVNRSVPRLLTSGTAVETDEQVKWLFRQADKVDRARGVTFEREPSEFMLRYREYELLHRILLRGTDSDEATWRLHPRLRQFSSIEEARDVLARDWVKFGYKIEVASAEKRFAELAGSEDWVHWLRADARFRAGKVYLDTERWVPQTILYPPPSAWLGLSSWIQMRSATAEGGGDVVFQLARVSVIRPWMALDDLLEGKLKIDWKAPRNSALIVSEGGKPSFDKFPSGKLSVIVDEILLVRDINWRGPENHKSLHPLGLYKFPDATNLVGYIVRVLPKIP